MRSGAAKIAQSLLRPAMTTSAPAVERVPDRLGAHHGHDAVGAVERRGVGVGPAVEPAEGGAVLAGVAGSRRPASRSRSRPAGTAPSRCSAAISRTSRTYWSTPRSVPVSEAEPRISGISSRRAASSIASMSCRCQTSSEAGWSAPSGYGPMSALPESATMKSGDAAQPRSKLAFSSGVVPRWPVGVMILIGLHASKRSMAEA